jgi:hypothetical protein
MAANDSLELEDVLAHEDCPADDIAFLIGQPSIKDYIGFAKTRAINGYRLDEAELAAEWCRARERLEVLEREEAGLADNPPLEPLPTAMREIADAALQEPEAAKTFHYLPHRWCMVDPDRLVVTQKHLNLRFVAALKKTYASMRTPQDLIDLALGRLDRNAKAHVTPLSETTFSFSSASSDFRFLETVLLDPALVKGCHTSGKAAFLLGVFVGFGVNFISAAHVRNRLVLFNGTHRLCALRELGVKRVPCLVRSVSRDEQLDVLGAADVRQNAQLYLRSPRPPLFKDYFDDQLRKVIAAQRTRRVLQLQVNMQQWRTPSL